MVLHNISGKKKSTLLGRSKPEKLLAAPTECSGGSIFTPLINVPVVLRYRITSK